MTSREIVLTNQNHSGAPRPGMCFRGEDMLNDFVISGPGNPMGYEQKRWKDETFEYYDDIWGNLWRRILDGSIAGEVLRPAIEEWSDLDKFQAPRFDVDLCAATYKAAFDAAPGKFKIAGMTGWVFAAARYIRKMEVYFMDLGLYPDQVRELHNRIAEVLRVQITAAGRAGADAIMFAEDMGTQTGILMSPNMWQDYFGELYAELFQQAHDNKLLVWMHSCGKNDEILEPLLKSGVNCFQFDQPTVYDYPWLSALLDKYRGILWSPIDIQKILPTGDREIIKAGVDDMLEYFEGKLVFNEYGDLPGIGVKKEWNRWGYEYIIERIGL